MREDEGFTIIEALVALAILATTLVIFYGVGANTLTTTRHVSKLDHAMLLAQSQLDTFSATTEALGSHETGAFSGQAYSWEVSTSDIETSRSGRNSWVLQGVTLTLHWHEGLASRSLSVETRHLGRKSS